MTVRPDVGQDHLTLYTLTMSIWSASRVGEAPEQYLIANIDGGARGNPGPAGYGVYLKDQSGKKVAALSKYLGHQTNNYAEYSGLIAALEYALEHGHRGLKVISDSELMVKQMRGQYKVKSPSLLELYQRAQQLSRKLDWFSIQHVLRAQNRDADGLANAAMDQGMGRSAPPRAEVVGKQEFEGIVQNGVIEITTGSLPDGTVVEIRVKRR
jgi:ribonuclease HI